MLDGLVQDRLAREGVAGNGLALGREWGPVKQARCLGQQALGPLLQLRATPAEPLLHLPAGPPLLPLGRVHIKSRQTPDPAQQGPVIAAAFRLPVNQLLGHHASEQHPAPTAQLLRRQAGGQDPRSQPFELPGGGLTPGAFPGQEWHHKFGGKLRTAIAVKARPQAGQAAHQHPAQGQPFRLGQQAMARLMDRNPAQAGPAPRQGFGQHMAATAAKTGRIQAEGPQSQDHRQHNPGRRHPHQGPDHGRGREAAHHQACP